MKNEEKQMADFYKFEEVEKQYQLYNMFKLQKELQEKLGNIKRINSCKENKQQFINQMILAIQEEAVEIIRETAYKNPDYVMLGWKKGQKWNEENFKDELIDMWHFVMNLCIAVDMDSDEFYERYITKNKINIRRENENY